MADRPPEVHGAVDLRPHDGGDPLRGESGDDPVVEHTGGVHDDLERKVAGRLGDRLLDVLGVGDVAGHDGHHGSEGGQLLAELRHPRGLRPAAAGQDESADSVPLDQVSGDQRAEPAGGARDEGGAVDGGPFRSVVGGRPDESADVPLPALQEELGLRGGSGDLGQRRVQVAVDDGQGEAARVLVLRRTHQTAHRGGGDVLVRGGAGGREHQARFREPLVREPGLDQVEGAGDRVPGSGGGLFEVAVPGADRHHDRLGGRVGQRGQSGGVRALVEERRGRSGFGAYLFGSPFQSVQRGRASRPQNTHRPQRQLLDDGDHASGGVHHQKGDRRSAQWDDPYPDPGGAGDQHTDPRPGERQQPFAHAGQVDEGQGVHGRVQQRRMQHVIAGLVTELARQGRLRHHTVTIAPGAPQSLEGRSVTEAALLEKLIEPLDRQLLTRTRDHRVRDGHPVAQCARGVAHPCRTLVHRS